MAHVLVVDDEPHIREVLSAQLADMRHSTDLAESAEAAFGLLAGREYDLVICDMGMPVERETRLRAVKPDLKRKEVGIEFLRAVCPSLERLTPCMVLTAWKDDFELAVDAMRVGACNFLTKPWDMAGLRVAVDRALERRADFQFRRQYQTDLESRLDDARREVRRTYEGTVSGIAAMLEGKDPSTMDHCLRVADYCTMLAREVGVPEERIGDVRLGALLHDIGKYKIPDAILLKPGSLTPDEWVVMRKHPEYGAEFVRRIPFLAGASEIIANHHERFDGGGYPRGISGEAIPLPARVFSVVDAFDAIVSKRCYKEALSPDFALQEIRRCSGTQFDPRVVDGFERLLQQFLDLGHVAGTPQAEASVATRAARPATVFDPAAYLGRTRPAPERIPAP